MDGEEHGSREDSNLWSKAMYAVANGAVVDAKNKHEIGKRTIINFRDFNELLFPKNSFGQ